MALAVVFGSHPPPTHGGLRGLERAEPTARLPVQWLQSHRGRDAIGPGDPSPAAFPVLCLRQTVGNASALAALHLDRHVTSFWRKKVGPLHLRFRDTATAAHNQHSPWQQYTRHCPQSTAPIKSLQSAEIASECSFWCASLLCACVPMLTRP